MDQCEHEQRSLTAEHRDQDEGRRERPEDRADRVGGRDRTCMGAVTTGGRVRRDRERERRAEQSGDWQEQDHDCLEHDQLEDRKARWEREQVGRPRHDVTAEPEQGHLDREGDGGGELDPGQCASRITEAFAEGAHRKAPD